MTKKEVLSAQKRLTESAFDFLEMSVSEIKDRPKYSVIHFATAIELLLKSRLMREHWTLIVERPSDAKLEWFLQGKCKTVGPLEAIKRLNDVCGENISKDAIAQIERISSHRNRMIHFFHEGVSPKADQKLVEEVAKEQCACWFYFERILSEWKAQFKPFESEIWRISSKMKRNRDYLAVAFERLLPKIETDKIAGHKFEYCAGCGFEAAQLIELSDMLIEPHCRVCGLADVFVEFRCPSECGGTVRISSDPEASRTCKVCGHEVTQQDLSDALDTECMDPTDYHDAMNCAFCGSHNTVVKHYDYYVCTDCLESSDEIAGCAWCSELQIGGGDLKWSYQTGCDFCDGYAGWIKDD